jgi:hypothetical protein
MITESAVNIHRSCRPTVAFTLRHSRLLVGNGLYSGRLGSQVGHLIGAGTSGFGILDTKVTGIVTDTRELLDLKGSHL